MTKLSNYLKTKAIPEAIHTYLETKHTNQAELARTAKVSPSIMSHIIKGDTVVKNNSKKGFTEIKDKYYEAICEVIDFRLQKEYWRHFNTFYFKQIIMTLKEARATKTRVAIDGDTGSGKSHACREYAKRYPTDTYIVTCSAIENSKEFAKNIAEVVGVETVGTAGNIIKKVIKKLLQCDNAILIIDEAEHIGNKSGYINIIKSLSDGLNNRVSLVLLGMGIADIFRKGYERRKQNFRQTARRFGHREILQESDFKEDIANICIEMGITNEAAQNYLINRIENFGDLESIIRYALKTAEKLDKEVNTTILKSWFNH